MSSLKFFRVFLCVRISNFIHGKWFVTDHVLREKISCGTHSFARDICSKLLSIFVEWFRWWEQHNRNIIVCSVPTTYRIDVDVLNLYWTFFVYICRHAYSNCRNQLSTPSAVLCEIWRTIVQTFAFDLRPVKWILLNDTKRWHRKIKSIESSFNFRCSSGQQHNGRQLSNTFESDWVFLR